MAKIQKIKVLSLAKLQGAMAAMMGLVAGIVYGIGGALLDLLVTVGWITSAATTGVGYGTALAFLALIGMPIIFGAAGFIAGLIEAVFYNYASGWVGGLEVDLEP